MEPLFGLVIATAVSMAIIPLMWRLAPVLGLIDQPDPRKVHTSPIPNVGGWGIVVGALVPPAFLMQWSPLLQAYLLGGLILFVFGIIDDRYTLSHRVKFIGQFAAAALVIYHGGLWIEHAPFVGLDSLPRWAGVTLTFIAIVGMINAMNTSDGLDGLAGGEGLLSLLVIAFLAFMVEGTETLLIAVTAIGGVLGFLRFNTHPARVFMGDSGSQFLGFSLAFLAIHLTQKTFASLSPATTLLFLGLPIIDIFAVMFMRVSRGESPFKAQRNHLHHRLLNLGFTHNETVITIYLIQALFVLSAILLRHESDWLIAAVYFGAVALIFGWLVIVEQAGWRRVSIPHRVAQDPDATTALGALATWPYYVVAVAVPLFLVFAAVVTSPVPRDFGITSAVLMVILLVEMLLGRHTITFPMRGAIYVAIVFVAYLTSLDRMLSGADWVEIAYFGVLIVAAGLTVRYCSGVHFETTPMDYLILAGVVIASVFGQRRFEMHGVSLIIVKAVLLLYASEIIIERMRSRWSLLNLATLFVLATFAYKGIFSA